VLENKINNLTKMKERRTKTKTELNITGMNYAIKTHTHLNPVFLTIQNNIACKL